MEMKITVEKREKHGKDGDSQTKHGGNSLHPDLTTSVLPTKIDLSDHYFSIRRDNPDRNYGLKK